MRDRERPFARGAEILARRAARERASRSRFASTCTDLSSGCACRRERATRASSAGSRVRSPHTHVRPFCLNKILARWSFGISQMRGYRLQPNGEDGTPCDR
eukprot:1849141-Pleurochrysis_carterae.AAC.1